MIIPEAVERKIRQTCSEIHDVEWSGILFYDYEGTFEDNNLVIKCIDFLLMDIGSSAYTEFNDSKDTLDYADKHPELYDHLHMQALIHSHNNMPTFFSGTDISTLREWGTERNNFVSLIVNNAGSYTAAITRKISYTRQIKETFSTKFFGEEERSGNRDYNEDKQERLEYYLLEIIKEESADVIETRERINEVKQKKELARRNTVGGFNVNRNLDPLSAPSTYDDLSKEGSLFGDNTYSRRREANYSHLFPKKEFETQSSLLDDDADYCDWDYFNDIPSYDNQSATTKQTDKTISIDSAHCNETIVKNAALQILTCNPLITTDSKLDMNKWLKTMPSVFTKRFGKPEGLNASTPFQLWAEQMVEFVVSDAQDPELTKSGFTDVEVSAVLAKDIIALLEKMKPSNIYIQTYINFLEEYLDYYE